ncbi:MAG: hypothetical protein PHH54_00720 [Candidatus Nanoarchaeia archaeon]|nr:hypothetical protein [Candidatus Nanoarchaeia archaeon]MDD5740485.1 hypothetical protein [Candidatus Nanoarchaeia archaeon]
MKEVYYAKSLEEDFVTKTLKGKKKVAFQSVENIVKRKVILPNTKSFGRQMRLSCTAIDKNYLKTYRPQGIIFKTGQKPEYILPFDLVLLSATNNIIVHYYRIKNNLHVYYNHTLIPGFQKFIFKDFNKLKKKFPTLKSIWKEVNKFRKSAGYQSLPMQKHRLVEYNEAVFYESVKITPVAIFGYRKEARKIARQLGLPYFVSAKQFYKDLTNRKIK